MDDGIEGTYATLNAMADANRARGPVMDGEGVREGRSRTIGVARLPVQQSVPSQLLPAGAGPDFVAAAAQTRWLIRGYRPQYRNLTMGTPWHKHVRARLELIDRIRNQ